MSADTSQIRCSLEPDPPAGDGIMAALLETARDGLLALSAEGPVLTVVMANEAARRLLGVRPGMPAADAPSLAGAATVLGQVKSGALPRADIDVSLPAGPEAGATPRTIRLGIARGGGHLLVSAADITGEQRLARDLRTLTDRFELAVGAARDGIWDWDLVNNRIWFSPQWKSHFGYADDEFANTLESWEGIIFPEDRDQALSLVKAYLAGEIPTFEAVQRFRHKDGHTVLIYSRAIKEVDAFGCPVRLVGAHTDITNVRELETALESAQTRLEDAIERLNDGFVLYDAQDRVVLTNSRFRDFYPGLADSFRPGITFEQMLRDAVGRGAIAIDPPDTAEDLIARRLAEHRNPGPPFERQLAGGRVIRVTEYPTAEGGIVSLGVDVTELRAGEKRFRDLVSTVPGMVFQWHEGPDGRRGFTYVSPRSREMYGIEPGDLERDWRLLPIHPEDAERWQAAIDLSLADGRDWSFEGRFLLADGSSRWWRGISRPLRLSPTDVIFNGIVLDIGEQKRAEEELRYREAILRYTTGLAGLGYWVWDPDRGTIYCSPDLAAIRGCTVEEYLDTLGSYEQQLEWVYPDDRDYYRIHAAEVARSRRSYVVEYRIRRPNGAMRHVREVGGPVQDDDGRLLKFVVALQDITERKQRELELEEARDRLEAQAQEMTSLARELERARDAAEAASLAKSRFLAVMSHELRTPMTGVIGMVDLMRGTPLSVEQGRYLETLRSSADSLLVVLNDILDFSKIEVGQLTLEQIPVSIGALVEDVINLFAPAAGQAGIALTCSLPDGPLPDVLGDPTRLRQVLMNLVGNAVKFTRSGSVDLRLAPAERDGRRHWRLRFEVTDTGIGIDPALKPVLFEAFTQADASTTRRFGGTGLGLAICKRLVGMMGGTIGVDSEVGRGSTFWFTVRMAADKVPDREEDEGVHAPEEQPAGIRLLLAEDNQVNRLLIVTMLQRLGFNVTAVVDGRQAVDAVQGQVFDLILMDMQMPEMDGDAAAVAIRALDGPVAQVPIVALTADVMPDDRNRRMSTRLFDGYVTKPIDWGRLSGLITSLVHARRAG